jgi:chaperonin GroES
MLTLSSTITLDKSAITSANLCDRFEREDLDRIGAWAHDNYVRDLASRSDWSRRTEAAMDLAMQLQKGKTFPWHGCANIAFPLVTIAAMQFHARAYPAIINGRSVVQARVVGEDLAGLGRKRADLVSEHMSWQLLEQDEAWEEEVDRALLNVAIVGCGFKKTYFNQGKSHNVSEFVQAKDLVVNYYAKSIDSAPVKTHVFPLFKNEVHERVLRGTFYDVLDEGWYDQAPAPVENTGTIAADHRTGTRRSTEDPDAPFTILEQHCSLDLDGDGYAEPYIITIEESTQTVLRIVTRFDRIEDIEYTPSRKIIRIDPMEYFTKIPFIPSPDGGILDIGFGILLGPLNESVNSAINQMFDAGTLSNTSGGFLGRGAKIRGGVYEFSPFSWNRVDSSGDDLRKNIVPLPVREPSMVMFNLLSLLIDYTNRVSGSTDMMAGENPGQNTPAETSRAMVEQGQKIYSAIFKRIWRSLKNEFKKLYTLNSIYLPMTSAFGDGGEIRREDYAVAGASISVIPVADPTISSDAARLAQAQLLREAANTVPGYDQGEVERRFLKSIGIDDVDKVYPGVDPNAEPTPDVKVQVQQMKNQVEAARLDQEKMKFMLTMQETVRLNTAKIATLAAQAQRMEAEATTVAGKANVEAFRAGIEAMRAHNDQTNAHLDRMMESFNESRNNIGAQGTLPSLEEPSSDAGAFQVPAGGTGIPEGAMG